MFFRFFIVPFFLFSFLIQAKNHSVLDKNIKKSVFQIRLTNGLVGTVFYLGDNFFITNAHNIHSTFLDHLPDSTQNISLFYFLVHHERGLFPFDRIVALDYKNDLAILRLEEKSFQLIESDLIPVNIDLSKNKDKEFKKGYVYGFPQFYDPLLKDDYDLFKKGPKKLHFIEKPKTYGARGDIFFTFLNNEFLPGVSGSPVFINDKVVGIARLADANCLGYVPIEKALSLLKNRGTVIKSVSQIQKSFQKFSNETVKDWRSYFSLSLFFGLGIRENINNKSLSEGQFKDDLATHMLILKKTLKHNPSLSIAKTIFYRYHQRMNQSHRAMDLLQNNSFPPALYNKAMYLLENNEIDFLKFLKQSAHSGYSPALYVLALYYFFEKNFLKYEKYMKKVALKGNLLAQNHLGLYYTKKIDKKNFKKIFKKNVFLKSVMEGNFKVTLQRGSDNPSYYMQLFKNFKVANEERNHAGKPKEKNLVYEEAVFQKEKRSLSPLSCRNAFL